MYVQMGVATFILVSTIFGTNKLNISNTQWQCMFGVTLSVYHTPHVNVEFGMHESEVS